jgi:UDP-2,3-diacylglucosamine pyrophosphatase LpxH
MNKRFVDLVIISDVHLGTYGCNAAELNEYLRSIQPQTLILNGDIIDMWNFNKNYFPATHMETVQLLMDFVHNGTKVYYITGNHDEMLRNFSDMKIGVLEIVDKLVLNLDGKSAWIFHGDIFDISVSHKYAKWIAKLGGKSYDWLILLNRLINKLLVRFGREKISLARKIKYSVKRAVQYVNDFEQIAAQHAINQQYDYVICGHIHQPQIKRFSNHKGTVTYLNSGDWVENLTALEYHEGRWRIFSYLDTFVPDMKEIIISAPDVDKIHQNSLAFFRK